MFEGACYEEIIPSSYGDAASVCTSLGGWLVTIDNADENEHLRNTFGDYFWIGYNDLLTEGEFVWDHYTESNYTNWAAGQPDNIDDEDCVAFWLNGEWNDIHCTEILKAVCEFGVSAEPTWEPTAMPTSPTSAPTQGTCNVILLFFPCNIFKL